MARRIFRRPLSRSRIPTSNASSFLRRLKVARQRPEQHFFACRPASGVSQTRQRRSRWFLNCLLLAHVRLVLKKKVRLDPGASSPRRAALRGPSGTLRRGRATTRPCRAAASSGHSGQSRNIAFTVPVPFGNGLIKKGQPGSPEQPSTKKKPQWFPVRLSIQEGELATEGLVLLLE